MFDLRLKGFSNANRLNFTKAAAELYITQPSVTKHIHELQYHFKVKLFETNGSRIILTAAGKSLHELTQQLFSGFIETLSLR